MICRLCLKDIPNEYNISLYDSLCTTSEAIDMVKIIKKYLEIDIKPDDIVSTAICQDCNDHLEEFHRYSQQVAEKQRTLRNEFLEVNLKKEYNFDDAWNNDDVNVAESKDIGMTVECPVDVFKDESDDDDEKDELEMPTADLMDTNVDTDQKDIIAPYSVAPNDINLDNISSEDDDVPLIKLKSSKKSAPKKKRKKAATKPRAAKPREPKEKKPVEKKPAQKKKKISSQKLIMELICDICQTQVDCWKALREHFLIAHTKTPYIKCCEIIYRKPRALIEHLEWHKNPEMFKCKVCDQNMSSASSLTQHITTEHPNETDLIEFYECEHCSKRIRNYNLYKRHLRSHIKDKEVECHICNKRFPNEYNLSRHIQTIHLNAVYHVCDICGRNFKNKDSFIKHHNQHKGIVDPAVQCSICNTWLKNKHSLRLHRFVHEKNPTPCDICGKMFETKHTLRKHKSYWHKSDLNLPCQFCEKVFRQQRNLDEHMAIHTGISLYACPHCGKESRSRSNMYVHIKRQHPVEWWKSKMERLNVDPNTTANPELLPPPHFLLN